MKENSSLEHKVVHSCSIYLGNTLGNIDPFNSFKFNYVGLFLMHAIVKCVLLTKPIAYSLC